MANDDNSGYWIGFDLGGTKMLATVYDSDFQPVGRKRKRTKGAEGTESVTSRMIRTLNAAIEDAAIDRQKIRGVGVGIPGPVDQEKGIVLEAVNLSWEKVPLGEIVGEEFDSPVVLLNDVDAGLYGEYRFGAAQSARTAMGFFPGTGIGGGCVYDGQIVRGKRNSCMEIGHINVTPNGKLCGCGLRGCLETEASRLAIASEVAAAAYRGETPIVLEEAGTDLANIRSGTLAKAINEGDQVVKEIVLRAARILGVAVATGVHMFSPDMIVLGGGLVEAMPGLYVEAVAAMARKSVMPSFEKTFEVVAAELGDDASVLGAAGWAAQTLAS